MTKFLTLNTKFYSTYDIIENGMFQHDYSISCHASMHDIIGPTDWMDQNTDFAVSQ